MTSARHDGRGEAVGGAPGDFGPPQVTILRKITFVAVLFFLFTTPVLLLVAALSTDFALLSVAQFTVFWFPLWGVFAVWVTLDASALYGFVGPRPDPLAPQALRLSALAIANIASMFIFW
jgi:hypothetical protein